MADSSTEIGNIHDQLGASFSDRKCKVLNKKMEKKMAGIKGYSRQPK